MITHDNEFESGIVQTAVDGIKEDFSTETSSYRNWYDMAESYIDDALCDLDSAQLSSVCGAFRSYIYDNAEEHYNLCKGILEAIKSFLSGDPYWRYTLSEEDYEDLYKTAMDEADEDGTQPDWSELDNLKERMMFTKTLNAEIENFNSMDIEEYNDGKEYNEDEEDEQEDFDDE